MKRRKRGSPHGRGAGFGNTQPGKLQPDHTLLALVSNLSILEYQGGHMVALPDGRLAVSMDAHLCLTAIRDHVGRGPAGQARFDAALAALRPRCKS